MNYDEFTHHFLLDFYESLSKNPELIDTFYLPDSKLIISCPNEPQKVAISNRFELLPKGDHKIFRWNGQKNGEQIIGHASGYVKVKIENEDKDQYFQCNEMVIYMHSDPKQNPIHPYYILYHSIHLTNMDPPPQPEPKPEPKAEQKEEQPNANTQTAEQKQPETVPQSDIKSPTTEPVKPPEPASSTVAATKTESKPTPTDSKAANAKPPTTDSKPPPANPKPIQSAPKGPVLVENPDVLIKSRTVLAINLPYSVPQSNILPEFKIYGKITRYATVKGRILIEFENPNSLTRALNDGNFYWNDRYIKIKQMDDQFNF